MYYNPVQVLTVRILKYGTVECRTVLSFSGSWGAITVPAVTAPVMSVYSQFVSTAMLFITELFVFLYSIAVCVQVKSKVTRWGQDEDARCSYSYTHVGVPMSAHDNLKAQVKGVLFFAGEATTRDYTGTVHGAYLTGVEAANECWNSLRSKGVVKVNGSSRRVAQGDSSLLEVAPVSSVLSNPVGAPPLIMSRL